MQTEMIGFIYAGAVCLTAIGESLEVFILVLSRIVSHFVKWQKGGQLTVADQREAASYTSETMLRSYSLYKVTGSFVRKAFFPSSG